MKINLQNYEEYFVRLIDGDLSSSEVSQVQLFLQKHPELQSEMDAFRMAVLQPDADVTFPGKVDLKQSVHEGNFEAYFSRAVDQDLSDDEMQEIDQFVQQNPSYRKQLDAYFKTKLAPDLSVVYPDKPALKKKGNPSIIPLYARYILSAAVAAILVFILFFKGFQWLPGNSSAPVASNEGIVVDTTASTTAYELPSTTALVGNAPDTLGKTNRLLPGKDASVYKNGNATKDINAIPENKNLLADMQPIKTDGLKPLPVRRRINRAPYLVPVYNTPATNQHELATNNISNQVGSLLSIASVVGSEILKLSGRGDLLKTPESEEKEKIKEPFTLSIQSKKFSFYHKFSNRKDGSAKK